MYKYVVYGQNGHVEHCDPYGFGMELHPGTCSIIRDLSEYTFTDEKWMEKHTRGYDKPMNIYELHLGSWKMKGNNWYSYNEIADELITYLKKYGYNYVEFMPLSEHPFDGSWGYQNTGFYAPTSRYGTAAQFMELIDKLHNAGIGAIMDFVPVHFAVDAYDLKEYDGTALYEYPHKDVADGGLGFDYKWDLGWMHDTLKYFESHPYDRAFMPDKITFSIYYAYNERYILPLSHDEVVHGKKTIIDKLNGSYEQKFAQARLLYLYMMTHPGKNLNFMGNEIAMFREWDETREPDANDCQ